jgi:hypothetical protein
MYDLIIPERLPEVKAIIEEGNTFDDAALIIFDNFTSKLIDPQTDALSLTQKPSLSQSTPLIVKKDKAIRRLSSAPMRPNTYHKVLSRSASACGSPKSPVVVTNNPHNTKTVGLSKRNPFAKQAQINIKARTPSVVSSLASSSAEVWDSDEFM